MSKFPTYGGFLDASAAAIRVVSTNGFVALGG